MSNYSVGQKVKVVSCGKEVVGYIIRIRDSRQRNVFGTACWTWHDVIFAGQRGVVYCNAEESNMTALPQSFRSRVLRGIWYRISLTYFRLIGWRYWLKMARRFIKGVE